MKLFQTSGQLPCFRLLGHLQPDDRLCGPFVPCVGHSLTQLVCDGMIEQ